MFYNCFKKTAVGFLFLITAASASEAGPLSRFKNYCSQIASHFLPKKEDVLIREYLYNLFWKESEKPSASELDLTHLHESIKNQLESAMSEAIQAGVLPLNRRTMKSFRYYTDTYETADGNNFYLIIENTAAKKKSKERFYIVNIDLSRVRFTTLKPIDEYPGVGFDLNGTRQIRFVQYRGGVVEDPSEKLMLEANPNLSVPFIGAALGLQLSVFHPPLGVATAVTCIGYYCYKKFNIYKDNRTAIDQVFQSSRAAHHLEDYNFHSIVGNAERMELRVKRWVNLEEEIPIQDAPKKERIPSREITFKGKKLKIYHQIGIGGSADVFDAEYDGHPVAAKILRGKDNQALRKVLINATKNSINESKRIFKSLERSRNADLLSHIVEVVDYDFSGADPMVLFKKVDGADWYNVFNKNKKSLDIFSCLEIARQAALGLAAAEEAGVIHKDLKPTEILIGRDGTVKVGDFGGKLGTDNQNVQLSNFLGSSQIGPQDRAKSEIYYPSKINEPNENDKRREIFALGMILHHMYLGKIPSGPKSLSQRVQASRPDEYRKLEKEEWTEIDAIHARMIDEDPNARFQNAKDLAKALEPILAKRGAVDLAKLVPEEMIETTPVEPGLLNSQLGNEADLAQGITPKKLVKRQLRQVPLYQIPIPEVIENKYSNGFNMNQREIMVVKMQEVNDLIAQGKNVEALDFLLSFSTSVLPSIEIRNHNATTLNHLNVIDEALKDPSQIYVLPDRGNSGYWIRPSTKKFHISVHGFAVTLDELTPEQKAKIEPLNKYESAEAKNDPNVVGVIRYSLDGGKLVFKELSKEIKDLRNAQAKELAHTYAKEFRHLIESAFGYPSNTPEFAATLYAFNYDPAVPKVLKDSASSHYTHSHRQKLIKLVKTIQEQIQSKRPIVALQTFLTANLEAVMGLKILKEQTEYFPILSAFQKEAGQIVRSRLYANKMGFAVEPEKEGSYYLGHHVLPLLENEIDPDAKISTRIRYHLDKQMNDMGEGSPIKELKSFDGYDVAILKNFTPEIKKKRDAHALELLKEYLAVIREVTEDAFGYSPGAKEFDPLFRMEEEPKVIEEVVATKGSEVAEEPPNVEIETKVKAKSKPDEVEIPDVATDESAVDPSSESSATQRKVELD